MPKQLLQVSHVLREGLKIRNSFSRPECFEPISRALALKPRTGEFSKGGGMAQVFRRLKQRLGEVLATPIARADDSKRFVKLVTGEETHAWGMIVKARAPSVLMLALSRHAVTVAVLDGLITQGNHSARSGEALVTTLEGGVTRLLRFDVQLLAATLPPKWRADATRSLSIDPAQPRLI
jgi:hypothetical protein